jgi:histidinol-phosphate aminotransferase
MIDLSRNESPAAPPAAVVDAVARAMASGHRYPDEDGRELREAVAARSGVHPDQVVLGAGSSDVMLAAWRAGVERDPVCILPWPSFTGYRLFSALSGARPREIPLRDGLQLDLEAMLASARQEDVGLVAICNPNNPTGSYIGEEDLSWFLDRVPRRVLVVCDEAYREFVDAPDFPRLLPVMVSERPNVLVVRTFSKAYGLAGLRIGYGVGAASLIGRLHRCRLLYNVPSLAQAAAAAALDGDGYVARSAAENARQRVVLRGLLDRNGFETAPSQGNFLYARPPAADRDWVAELRRRGVLVSGWSTHLRITVARDAEHAALLRAVRAAAGDSRERNPAAHC